MDRMPELSSDPNEGCWWQTEPVPNRIVSTRGIRSTDFVPFHFDANQENFPPSTGCIQHNSNTDDPLSNRYSAKVFVGGIPLNTDERVIRKTFGVFDQCEVNWPNRRVFKEAPPNGEYRSMVCTQGYCFIHFRHSEAVRALVNACHTQDGNHFFRLCNSSELVQVRPWCLTDSTYTVYPEWYRFVRLSVFIGGLPRTLKAKSLFDLVDALFGNVIHCSMELEFDSSYPKGAARVIFCDVNSYKRAALAGHVEHGWFPNKNYNVEFKPFTYNCIPCEFCGRPNEPTDFCLSEACLMYYCTPCFALVHSKPQFFAHQKSHSLPRDLPNPCRMELQQKQERGGAHNQIQRRPPRFAPRQSTSAYGPSMPIISVTNMPFPFQFPPMLAPLPPTRRFGQNLHNEQRFTYQTNPRYY